MPRRWQEVNGLKVLGLVDDLEAVIDAEQPVELIVCDLIGDTLLAVLLAPLMLVVAVLVKLTSRGPVLFVDGRIGLGQRAFRLYEFRTHATRRDGTPG
jgi:lipopolysaccharide/colanic/teichoic acid biosynthesis glycosyltransferase